MYTYQLINLSTSSHYLIYNADGDLVSLFPYEIPTGFIHTAGGDEKHVKAMGVENHIKGNEMMLKMIFGSVESLVVTDTLHVDYYTQYVMSFDGEEKNVEVQGSVFLWIVRKSLREGHDSLEKLS